MKLWYETLNLRDLDSGLAKFRKRLTSHFATAIRFTRRIRLSASATGRRDYPSRKIQSHNQSEILYHQVSKLILIINNFSQQLFLEI